MCMTTRVSPKRLLLWIGYDGSKFPEMARGGTGFGVVDLLKQTVTNSLEELKLSTPEEVSTVRLSPSSRTDAGVHAIRNAVVCRIPMKASLSLENAQTKEKFLDHCNSTMDLAVKDGMKLLNFDHVSPHFCVRRHVSYRRYTYRIAVCRDWDTFEKLRYDPSIVCFSERNYIWLLPPEFDLEKARNVTKCFEGVHVMGSFFKHTAREKRKEVISLSAIRNILLCNITKGAEISIPNSHYDYYNVTVVAKSFLREQIRRMMSCIVYHSYNRMPMETVEWLIRNPIDTSFFDLKIPVAPPHGLFLTDVVYDPTMFDNPFPKYADNWVEN
ncbi:unnamed protein product [Auanema sp. JU1783]|nr:unnamed protein product [Auanema sp. JU1783]